jgi:hypothetical protein
MEANRQLALPPRNGHEGAGPWPKERLLGSSRQRVPVRHADASLGQEADHCTVWGNVDTLMKHYVRMDEQQVTDDVFEQMYGVKK